MNRAILIHPDLGLGGAERLIIDIARALQDSLLDTTIYTGHYDKTRCFKETGSLKVVPVGSWIPRSIFGLCHALLANLKMIYIALYVVLYSRHQYIILDQVSGCIPILKWLNFRNKQSKIIFYCHFPDQLLTTRKTLAKKLYRKPLDRYEEWTTSLADVILVNSNFTRSVVRRTFKSLAKVDMKILYPCVDLQHYHAMGQPPETNSFTFLSINRFERKKNLGLAIEAFGHCLRAIGDKMKIHLNVAGGYDERIKDCVTYYAELTELVAKLALEEHVTLIKSPSDPEKLLLLANCQVVVYTPENEHFGIVPLEAMAMGKPVIASASGGPLETIESGSNGILCPAEKSSFAEAMYHLASDPTKAESMGNKGAVHVRRFSYQTFQSQVKRIILGSSND